VALAASHGSTWGPGNCSGAAENAGARSASITAILAGNSKAGSSCSITIVGKFSTLPAKNTPVSGFVHVVRTAKAGIYKGTIKTKTFTGTLTLSAVGVTMTLPNSGCGWTYQWIGGHWVAMYTTC